MVQQSEALLVGDRGEGVIGVDFLQTGHQVRQGVVGTKGVHLSDDADRVRNTGSVRSAPLHRLLDPTESCRSFQPPMALNCLNCSLSKHLPIILSR